MGLGVGAKILVHELPHYHGDDPVLIFLPGGSCIIICLCINVIRLTHPFDYSDKHPHLVLGVWIVRLVCIGLMFGMLFTWKFVNHGVILGVYLICFLIQIFIDFEAKHRLIVTKSADKDKSLGFYKSPKAAIQYRDSIQPPEHTTDPHHASNPSNPSNGHTDEPDDHFVDHEEEKRHGSLRKEVSRLSTTRELSFIGAF